MWEYKNVTLRPHAPFAKQATFSGEDLTSMLESYGNAGWELVSVAPVCELAMGWTTELMFFFKRPK